MRLQMSISKEMANALKSEQNERMLGGVQETMRSIIADYFMIKKMQEPRENPRKAAKEKKEEKIEFRQNPLIV